MSKSSCRNGEPGPSRDLHIRVDGRPLPSSREDATTLSSCESLCLGNRETSVAGDGVRSSSRLRGRWLIQSIRKRGGIMMNLNIEIPDEIGLELRRRLRLPGRIWHHSSVRSSSRVQRHNPQVTGTRSVSRISSDDWMRGPHSTQFSTMPLMMAVNRFTRDVNENSAGYECAAAFG